LSSLALIALITLLAAVLKMRATTGN